MPPAVARVHSIVLVNSLVYLYTSCVRALIYGVPTGVAVEVGWRLVGHHGRRGVPAGGAGARARLSSIIRMLYDLQCIYSIN